MAEGKGSRKESGDHTKNWGFLTNWQVAKRCVASLDLASSQPRLGITAGEIAEANTCDIAHVVHKTSMGFR